VDTPHFKNSCAIVMLNWKFIMISLVKSRIIWWLMSLKIHIKKFILDKFLIYMLRMEIEIHQKMIMIWTYEKLAHFKPFKSSQLLNC